MLLKKVMSDTQLLYMGKQLLNLKHGGLKRRNEASNWNNNGINAIFNGVTPLEFRRISICSSAKVTWYILRPFMKAQILSNR